MTGKLDVLAAAVIKNFRERGLSLSLAESCTGGMIAAALTGVPGASDIFWGSLKDMARSAKNARAKWPRAPAEYMARTLR